MIRKLIGLLQPRYRTLNSVEISRSALVYNYNYLIKRSGGKKIAPVLKSNAYGHGIVEVAKILDPERPAFLCVDSIFEAYQLLKARIKSPILIMGYVHPDNLKVKKLPFIFNVYTVEMLETIRKHQPEAKVHIFVDTGMHREGVPLNELADFIKKAKELDIQIDGLTSHFAMAEKIDNPDTRRQVEKFKKSISLFNDYGIYPTWVHISASTGLLNSEIYNSLGNLSRGGIALYGIDLLDSDENLQPVLKLTSTVIQIKELKKGEKIGYDFTHTAEKI